MFFLRCIFWLSIVYASMSWTREALAPSETRDRSSIANLRDKAVDGLFDLCRLQPAECVADAARLSALIETGALDKVSDKTDPPLERPEMVPMPVPDPRRHARDAQLTRAP